MFSGHFKISFSSISKALKLKNNIVHNEHSDNVFTGDKNNALDNKSKIQNEFITKLEDADSKLNEYLKDNLEHPLNGNKFINPIYIEKNIRCNKLPTVSAEKYNVSNCKIENCCCKSFFREESFNTRNRLPLREHNANQNRSSVLDQYHIGANNSADNMKFRDESSCLETLIESNRKYNSIGYVEESSILRDQVLYNKDSLTVMNDVLQNNKLKHQISSKENMNLNISNYNKSDIFLDHVSSMDSSINKLNNTPRISSKFKTVNVKSRLGIMDVTCKVNSKHKVKNIRQIKRLKQIKLQRNNLNRMRTFSGYDNLAYRKSVTDINCLKDNLNKIIENNNSLHGNIQNRNNIVINNSSFNEQCNAKNRMQIYYSNALPDTNRNSNSSNVYIFNKTSKVKETFQISRLQRHGSFGYFQNDSFENEYKMKRRLSLDELSTKVSASCRIKNLPDVSKKLANHVQSQNIADIHVHALFSAVEHGQVEKTKTILESSDVNVNSVNSDGLSPLDVAVLSNNKPLIKVLIAYGAQDGRKFYSAEDLHSHLMYLLHESERRVHELGSSLRINDVEQPFSSSSSSNIPAITVGDSVQCKTFSLWERRTKGLRSMLLGLEKIRAPDIPNFVNVEVTSASSIMVYFQESDNKDSPNATKFRVQWSLHKDFSTINGHFEITDPRQLCYHMTNLKRGHSYYVRVSCGNLKGYSPYKTSTPYGMAPSSWNDISSKDIRSPNAARIMLDDIFNVAINTHSYLKNTSEVCGSSGELLGNPRRRKTTIKQLFTAASKFQKHLRRGVYLACLLYHEDKVLVTNEDFLPVIEVDDTFPKKINADFHWFFKVASCWSDLKWLKSDMEKSQNSSIVFRIKLLQAATQMQTALSIQELGKLYHKLIKDSEGTIVISIINYIRSPKSVSVLNLRWLPLAKLIKRTNMMNIAESNVGDLLMSAIPDQITYHQVSSIRLPRGLYLGYLKMRSSMESLQILVPSRAPNIPPHCKIRDNPHVTAEEWEWLTKKENLKESLSGASYHQRLFIEQVAITTRRLFTYMEISSDEAAYHRLYDAEVIEISKDVSLIMVLPPTEAACSIPGQLEILLQRPDLLPLTVQIFEMVHFGTYQHDLVTLYSRLSCIIEMDIDLAQHSLRKAFSSAEVNTAKSRLADLENLQTQLNSAWKLMRWILDVISYSRDRLSTSTNSNSIQCLLSIHLNKRTFAPNESRCFLQPPETKTAKSRGSWPGVGVGRHLGRMPTEMSRSEQQLTSDSMNPSQTTAAVVAVTADVKSLVNPQPPQSSSHSHFSFQASDLSLNRTTPAGSEDIIIQLPVDPTSPNLATPRAEDTNDSVPYEERKKVAEIEESITVPVPTPAIVQVYAAYNTGLACGTSLKLHVSPKTTAREVVELFVKQLNMSVLLKGKEGPVYPTDQFPKFCLVAVIGARERCLRDDFKLLQLQQPWKDGRLYVRRKSDVLAAIEHSSKQASTFV